ncbi:MAG: DUF1538 domain-containing protein [Thiovulaceae bacterium]|nr:DUF1538 domain-containing protein [Sulfurimonadaceae bacterium]
MDKNKLRYGEFVREIQADHVYISYSDITNSSEQKSSKIKLRIIDVYRLVTPYISVRLLEQIYSLMPLALYLVIFQIFILRQELSGASAISVGLLAVIMGLMFFMEGIKQGLMPFGELIGNTLPKKVHLNLVLLIAFILGIGVTFAEPAIGALKTAGALVDVKTAPYLYLLLNDYASTLVLLVGGGVGLAAVLGTLRFIYSWSLKPFIYMSIIPTLVLTAYLMTDENLSVILGLAYDSGAVTTGPVTVPLVLALGIGIASAAGKGNNSLSGFGIVTLASVFPIFAVMLLGLFLSFNYSPQDIIELSLIASDIQTIQIPWYDKSPFVEMLLGIRAILPLVLFLFFVLKVILKEKLANSGIIIYGIVLAIFGMMIFNVGLTYGLAALGEQSGSLVAVAFSDVVLSNGQELEALYPYFLGLFVAVAFAWILGFGATLAEPALNALGITVENLTQGTFKKRTLMVAVSLGVGTGIAVGVLKIIFNIPIAYLLIPFYIIALIFTYFSDEKFVNIAWDSAGVTTGPITVPLVLAMGLGFGNAMNVTDGFGILSMASIGPIIAVLVTGLYVKKSQEK